MAPGQRVPLGPAFTVVFAQHFQDAAIDREVIVEINDWTDEETVLRGKDIIEPVR